MAVTFRAFRLPSAPTLAVVAWILAALVPCSGYNLPDSFLISEGGVADDRCTSVHIEELTGVALQYVK